VVLCVTLQDLLEELRRSPIVSGAVTDAQATAPLLTGTQAAALMTAAFSAKDVAVATGYPLCADTDMELRDHAFGIELRDPDQDHAIGIELRDPEGPAKRPATGRATGRAADIDPDNPAPWLPTVPPLPDTYTYTGKMSAKQFAARARGAFVAVSRLGDAGSREITFFLECILYSFYYDLDMVDILLIGERRCVHRKGDGNACDGPVDYGGFACSEHRKHIQSFAQGMKMWLDAAPSARYKTISVAP
jgi:hypothetical protein